MKRYFIIFSLHVINVSECFDILKLKPIKKFIEFRFNFMKQWAQSVPLLCSLLPSFKTYTNTYLFKKCYNLD